MRGQNGMQDARRGGGKGKWGCRDADIYVHGEKSDGVTSGDRAQRTIGCCEQSEGSCDEEAAERRRTADESVNS